MAKSLRYSINIEGTKKEAQELGVLQTEIDNVKRSLKQLTAAEKKQGALTKAQSSERARLNTQLKGTKNAYRDVEAQVLKTNNALRKNSGFVSGVKKGMMQWGASMIGVTAAITVLTKVVGGAAKTIKEFDQKSAQLAAILGKTKASITSLTNEAKRLGGVTAKTAGEVLELQTAYARLGFSQKEIINLTEATISGSIAMNAGLDETAELTGAVVRTFDDFSTTDAPEIIDIMSAATSKSALNFQKLQTAIPVVAGAANAAGVPFTTLTALLGKLSDSGIDASSSATALRNIFIESASQGLSYDQILDKIKNSQDKLTASNDEFGKRAAVSATVLAKNIDSIQELDEALQDAGGTAERMADEQLDTLSGSFTLLGSAWDGWILSLEDGKGPMSEIIKGFAELTTMTLNWMTQLSAADEAQQKFDQTLEGNKRQAIDQIALTQSQVKEDKRWLAGKDERLKALGIELSVGKITGKVWSESIDQLTRETEERQRAHDVGREYLNLVVKNKDAILALTDAEETETEAAGLNANAQAETAAQLKARLKALRKLKEFQDKMEQEEFDQLNKRNDAKAAAKKKAAEELAEEFDLDFDETGLGERISKEDEMKEKALLDDLDRRREHEATVAEIQEAAINTGFNAAQQASDELFAIEADRINRTVNRELEANKLRYDEGEISLDQYLTERDRLEKNALEKQKERQRKQILINTALAIMSALATVQPTIPAGIIAAGSAAVAGGVQLAVVDSQKFAKGGKLQGRSHAEGGIHGNMNGQPFEVEGDEVWISNKKASRDKTRRAFYGTPEEMMSSMNALHGGKNWKPGGRILSQDRSPDESLFRGPDLVGALNGLSGGSEYAGENMVDQLKLNRKTSIKLNHNLERAINKSNRSMY